MMDDFRPTRPRKPIERQKVMAQTEVEQEPAFHTPEEVAASDDVKITRSTEPKRELPFDWPPSRQVVIISAVVILVLLGATLWLLNLHRHNKTAVLPKTAPIVKPTEPAVTTVPSSLSGLPVDPSVNKRPVTGIMIENSLDARPQSGLSQASVVFEAIAEGGITRFLALYQDQQPPNIGPVRSARPYYLQWDLGFDAPLAHVGGSPEALQDIKDWGVKNLDQFANAGAYARIKSRAAPHNVYTNLSLLSQLEARKGFTNSSFSGFPRKKDAPSTQPNARSVDFAVSSRLYNDHYDYDAASNSFKRSEGGAAHIDANTGKQLSPKVVIAIVISYNLEADHKHSQYGTVGTGKAYVFQDGTVTIGTWSKLSASAQITFTDANNQPVSLNAGQTWITAVSAASKVSYR